MRLVDVTEKPPVVIEFTSEEARILATILMEDTDWYELEQKHGQDVLGELYELLTQAA